ncbi:hypothetical protein ACFVZ8_16330, partial [Streptomyces sp. NPDC059558]
MRTGLAGRTAPVAALALLLCAPAHLPAHALEGTPPGSPGGTAAEAAEAAGAAGAALVRPRA